MRHILQFMIFVLIAIGIFYILEINDFTDKGTQEITKQEKIRKPKEHDLKQNDERLSGDIYDWMGQQSSELEKAYGEPVRKDKSRYGYNWWVYNDLDGEYAQFGIKDGSVQTIYAIGENASLNPLSIEDTYADVQNEFDFNKEIKFRHDGSRYTFQLSDDDLKSQPLIKINDDLFIQAYMDTHTEVLMGVRIVSADILLSLKPYNLTYQGSLSEEKEWSDEEWDDIQSGMERQILDITNIFRKQFGKDVLDWDQPLHKVALAHSKDMENQDYFSHVSPNGDGLSERLEENGVSYQSAGENIAADYTDGPAVVTGWLNSEGHRKIMLDASFTKLGVGVYRNYFTQNYLN